MTPEAHLEALLFWKGEPMSKKKIMEAFGCTAEQLEGMLTNLEQSLSTRGIRLMRLEDDVELRTSPETNELIATLTKEELVRDLGKAGLETLSIILYKSPIKRSEIDYIRGVNSSFIVRNLLVRGLVERVTEKDGAGRGYSYKPTMDLLAHLGIAKIEDLPDYEKVKAEFEAFAEESKEVEKVETPTTSETEIP